MKTYKITNLEITGDDHEANVHDFFDIWDSLPITDRRFASREAAERFVQDHYLGEDEYGTGVRWEIVEDTDDWFLVDEEYDTYVATPEQVEESTNVSAEGWIEVDGRRVYADRAL